MQTPASLDTRRRERGNEKELTLPNPPNKKPRFHSYRSHDKVFLPALPDVPVIGGKNSGAMARMKMHAPPAVDLKMRRQETIPPLATMIPRFPIGPLPLPKVNEKSMDTSSFLAIEPMSLVSLFWADSS